MGYDDAVAWYERALYFDEQLVDADPARRCDLFIALAAARLEAGLGWRQPLLDAAALAIEIGDDRRLVRRLSFLPADRPALVLAAWTLMWSASWRRP